MTIERTPMRRGQPNPDRSTVLPPGTVESLNLAIGRMFLSAVGSTISVITPDIVEINYYGINQPSEVYVGEQINEARIIGSGGFFQRRLYRWVPTNGEGQTAETPRLKTPIGA